MTEWVWRLLFFLLGVVAGMFLFGLLAAGARADRAIEQAAGERNGGGPDDE